MRTYQGTVVWATSVCRQSSAAPHAPCDQHVIYVVLFVCALRNQPHKSSRGLDVVVLEYAGQRIDKSFNFQSDSFGNRPLAEHALKYAVEDVKYNTAVFNSQLRVSAAVCAHKSASSGD